MKNTMDCTNCTDMRKANRRHDQLPGHVIGTLSGLPGFQEER